MKKLMVAMLVCSVGMDVFATEKCDQLRDDLVTIRRAIQKINTNLKKAGWLKKRELNKSKKALEGEYDKFSPFYQALCTPKPKGLL